MAIARRFAEMMQMSGYCVIILRRKQGGKKMTLQQILEKVKKGQLSVEHAEDLLKKEGYRPDLSL